MQLSSPVEVFNLDDFLPVDGEDKFDIFYSDNILNLDVFYETTDSVTRPAKRRIRFLLAKYFFKTPFPGYSFFNCPDHHKAPLLNSLVEYENSELLDMENKTVGSIDYRHYRLFLHSAGVAIHVIAKSCEISIEDLIS